MSDVGTEGTIMSPFPKTCGVCDQTCCSKEEWTLHLLQITHSNRTKDPSHSWMNGPTELKKCSLFTMEEGEGPLDRRGILDYFASGGTHVVDLFYCSCHPCFAMIQFESKSKAAQLLKEMGSEISIDGRVVRLKKAFRPKKRILVTPNTLADEVASKKQKPSGQSTEGAEKEGLAVALMTTPVKNNAVDPNLSEEKLVQEVVTKKKRKKKPSKQTVDDKENLEERLSDNLVKEYTDICSLVEISPQEFQLITDLLERIKEVFKEHYPKVSVTLFRHWYLKLWNGGSNQLLVYLSEVNYQPLGVSPEDIEKQLRTIGIYHSSSRHQNEVEAGVLYETSPYAFEVITDGNFRAEVSKCCWTSHLIKFDTRAKSLLTLVHFWARENRVTLAEDGIAKKQQFDAIPDPGALEWLCVLFLIHEKIIPDPNEVISREKGDQESAPNEGMLFIQFSENCSDFMDSWKARKGTTNFLEGSKEYILDVLRLARDFFQFRTSTSGSFCSFAETKFKSSIEPLMKMTARKLDVFLATRDQNVVGADLKSLFRPEDLLNPAPSKVSMKLELEQMMADVEKELKAKHQNIMDLKCGCQFASGVCDAELLRCHFSSEVLQDDLTVMSEMEVEDRKNTQQKLKELFEAAGLVNCNLICFRSGHLKLLYGDPFSGDDLTFFFLDHDGLYGERNGKREVLQVNANMRQEMINKVESKGEFEDMWLLVEPFLEVLAVGENEDMSTLNIADLGGTADFSIAPRFYFPEVQANRLVEYLCLFDPRVKPLLAVIFYWVDVNDIRLGKVGQEYERIGFAPEPAVLEWLVLYFLGSRKIVPSPNDIIKRSPDATLFFDGVDVGFKLDSEHAREWRSRYKDKNEEKHVWNVYCLAKQFFAFCHDIGKKAKVKPMVVDLKLFRYFSKCEMNRLNDTDKISKLTGVSVEDLKMINSEPMIREGFYSPSEALTFLHPVHVKYGLSFCCDTFLESISPKMGVMAERLRELLGTYSKKGRKKHGRMEYDDSFDDEVNSVFKL